MSDDKVLILCLSVCAITAMLCLRSCRVAEVDSTAAIKTLCIQAGGTFEYGACKLPVKE